MAFKFPISPERRARIDYEQSEMARLHGLPDAFLARALLKLKRDAVAELPAKFASPPDCGYEGLILWHLIPAIAQRLGETRLTADEENCARTVPFDPAEFRFYAGNCLSNSSMLRFVDGRDGAVSMLDREIANGSPIAIGVDRLVPPGPDSHDGIVRHMRQISRVRFGHEEFLAWEPAFQDYERSRAPQTEEAEDIEAALTFEC